MARVIDINKLDNIERRDLVLELVQDLSEEDLLMALDSGPTSEQKIAVYEHFGEQMRSTAD